MPKGASIKTPERVREAQRLRAQGWKLREMAPHFGVGLSTVSEWLADPDAAKHKARRMKYGGECSDCGAPTDGSAGPGRASKRCRPCEAAWRGSPEGQRAMADRPNHGPIVDDEAIIAALQMCAEAHGGYATIDDYAVWAAQYNGAVPSRATIIHSYGWNGALRMAGIEPRRLRPNRYRNRIPREKMTAAVARVWRELGRSPTYQIYEDARIDGEPSGSVMQIRLDPEPRRLRWMKVLEATRADYPDLP